jgi:hypothetical protein
MTEDFETILKAGAADFGTRISPPPAEAVRVRGDQLLQRRRAATAALAVVLVAAVGGGAFAATDLSRHSVPPAAVAPQRTTSAPSRPATTAPSPRSTSSCQSLVVPQEVKDAVTEAYRQSQTGLTHIAPEKGSFYYGKCDGVSYAGTRFAPTSGATLDERVQLQDDGGAEKYFTKSPNGKWTYVATDGLPRSPRGCAAIPQIPASLAALWADCK